MQTNNENTATSRNFAGAPDWGTPKGKAPRREPKAFPCPERVRRTLALAFGRGASVGLTLGHVGCMAAMDFNANGSVASLIAELDKLSASYPPERVVVLVTAYREGRLRVVMNAAIVQWAEGRGIPCDFIDGKAVGESWTNFRAPSGEEMLGEAHARGILVRKPEAASAVALFEYAMVQDAGGLPA